MGWEVVTIQYLFQGRFYKRGNYIKLRREYLEKLDKKIERKRKLINFLDRFF